MTAALSPGGPAWDEWPPRDWADDEWVADESPAGEWPAAENDPADQARQDLAPEQDLTPGQAESAPLPDRQQQIAQLRHQLATVPATGARAVEAGSRTGAPGATPGEGRVLPVPEPLRPLIPLGGLARGSVVALSGASTLLAGLVATVTASGGWAALVGRPDLGVLAAVEMGADLRRVSLVPRPGRDPVDVAAVLLDGMDIVVLDLGGMTVAPSRARAVTARARSRGAVLAVTGGAWPGAELELHAAVTAYLGIGRGHGRVVGRELAIRVRGRGQAAMPRTSTVQVRADGEQVRWLSAVAPIGLARTGTEP